MAQGIQEPEHVWVVMTKAKRALTRYAAAGIDETGLGLSDFGVLGRGTSGATKPAGLLVRFP